MPGHNIGHCSHPSINNIFNTIKNEYIQIILLTSNNDIKKHIFTQTINRRFNLNELKVICVKYLNSISRFTKGVYCNLLWDYFQNYYQIRPLIYPEPVSEAIPASPQPSEITWYIDRTPSFPPIPGQTNYDFNRLIYSNELDNFVNENFNYNDNLFDIARNLLDDFDNVQDNKINIKSIITEEKENEEYNIECAICYESISSQNLVKLNCNHEFCGTCINSSLTTHNNIYCGPTCALCRTPMESFIIKNQETFDLLKEYCSF
jgi:hypothetical protein